VTLGPLATTASFIVDAVRAWVSWVVRLESLRVAEERREVMAGEDDAYRIGIRVIELDVRLPLLMGR